MNGFLPISADTSPLSSPARLLRLLLAVCGVLTLAPAGFRQAEAVPHFIRPSLHAGPAATRRVAAAISSTAAGGNWSAPATWIGGVVPTAADNVTIVAGATVTLNVAAATGSLTVNSGGNLITSATTAYSLAVSGSVVNNGTLNLSATATLGSDLRFVGAGSVTFSGSGTTDLYSMSLAKSALTDVVDMNLPGLSVKTSATAGTGFLLTRTTAATPADDMTGTLKISGTATISNQVFGNAAAYVIPATGAFWLSNPNYTVIGQTGNPTVNGQLRLTAGTFNVGTASGNSLLFGTASALTVEGGTLSSAGRIGNFTGAAAVPGAMTFTQSGGTINVATIGNASGTPSFGIAGSLAVSGGTINLVQRSTATTPLDYYVAQYAATSTVALTGGTLNVGTAATATNFDFRLRGSVPNLTVDNTANAKTALLANNAFVYGNTLITAGATLNLNAFTLIAYGPTFTNNGTLAGSTAGSTLYLAGSVAQTVGGGGTYSLLRSLTIDNSSAGGVTLGAPLATYRVNMFTGNLAGTSNLTIGDGTTVLSVVQIGVAGNTNTSGSFTSAPNFNIGTGAYLLLYNQETTARTTGFEIPATRVVDGVTISNSNGVTLAGGNLTINTSGVYAAGTLTLTSGLLTTSAANTVILGAAATTLPTGSATSYVRGPEAIIVNSPTAVSRTFAVGDAAGWRPVVVSGISTSGTQTYTATVVSGATGGTPTGGLSSLNATRYVRLQNTASLPASATVQLSYGADDAVGAPITAVVAQASAAAGSYASLGGTTATTPTTGIASTQNLVPGQDFFVLANTEGGTLSTSTASGCAGSTSGTLTLSGNAAGSTVVKYQADTGSGFVDVPGTNTGTTYSFSNLTTTTTFRAVLTTSDGRTVTSAPVTVTVTPAAASTFSYPAGPYCTSGTTNPTPTITGASGGTFSAGTGLTLNAATGTVTLSSSTPGTYTVTYTAPGTCGSSSQQQLIINAAPTASFAYPTTSTCAGTATTLVPALSAGATAGTFSLPAATGLSVNASTGAVAVTAAALAGTYTVTNTVAAANGCAAVTSTASFTITSCAPPTTTWTAGAGTQDWFTAGNWSAGVPTSSTDAFIPTGVRFYPLVTAAGAATRNLTINSTGSVTLAIVGALTVNGALTNGGSIVQSAGTLTVTGNMSLSGTISKSAGTIAIAGSLTNSGTLTNSGGDLSVNSLSNISSGTVSQVGGTLSVSGDLLNNSTFITTNAAGTSGGTVLLGGGGSASSILGSQAIRFWNLTLQAGGGQLVTSAGASVRRVLTLTGNLTTNTNTFIIESASTGDALVVNNGGVVNGNATVQRYIDPSQNPGLGYRHYSAPVSTSTVADLATTTGFSPVVNPAYNTSATPTAEQPFPTVFGYDERRTVLSNNLNSFDKGFFSPGTTGDALTPGRGYTVNIGASQLVDFVGSLNNGDVPLSLSSTRASNSDAGWHLVGNPYPAPLSYNLVATTDRPNLDGAIYVFSSSSQYGGTYRAYNNNIGNPVVPMGQGFFVRVSSGAASGALTFRNSQRLTAPSSTTFQRAAETRPVVQLTLQKAGSALADEAYVYFQAGATAGFDSNFDATKLANPSGLNLSAQAAGQQLAIDGQPELSTTQRVVPLAVGVPAAGSYTLTAAQLLNLSQVPTYLRDKQTGALIDLAQQPSYSFSVSNATTWVQGRFELVFSPQQVLATTPAALAEQVGLYPNPAKSQVTVELPADLGRQAVTVALVDALGRTVHTQVLRAGVASHTLLLTELATGVYSLRLHTELGTVVKKLVVE